MICESGFIIKKNGDPHCRCFCRRPELIENYGLAVSDTTQMWPCHHRLETHNSDGERRIVGLSKEELIALDMYYDRPPEELIFMTRKEHNVLHNKGERNPMYSKHHSDEVKGKMRAAQKSKKVLCVETGEVFSSIKDAYRKTGIRHISEACHGNCKTAGGFHWQFV